MDELTPLTAVTAADPYPYYRSLVATRPFAYDNRIGAWVAAGAESVDAVLNDAALRVRPASEPVPAAIVGTSLGEIFARIARMTDGWRHAALRHIAVREIERLDLQDVSAAATLCAQRLANELSTNDADALTGYLHAVPAMSIAAILGIGNEPDAETWVRDFARALSPASTGADVAEGITAANALIAKLGVPDDWDATANRIALLFQTYDATAGLIGNTLVRLAKGDESAVDAALAHVIRYDGPAHNTRRYAAADTVVMDAHVRSGDIVLVLLAAANIDPRGNRSYTFGSGEHACVGAQIATTIARAGIEAVLNRGIHLTELRVRGYQPSLNVRIPLFGAYSAATSR